MEVAEATSKDRKCVLWRKQRLKERQPQEAPWSAAGEPPQAEAISTPSSHPPSPGLPIQALGAAKGLRTSRKHSSARSWSRTGGQPPVPGRHLRELPWMGRACRALMAPSGRGEALALTETLLPPAAGQSKGTNPEACLPLVVGGEPPGEY